ncbi:MAG: Holliday junction branch migration protein RuvA [Gemmatimonadota bacterium]
MISRLRGTLLSREEEVVEVATAGGVVYELDVPLSVAERLPPVGEEVELRTVLLVREDQHALFGFHGEGERALFRRLLTVKGVGAKVAVGMLSAFAAPRLVQILVEGNVPALTQVSGIGKRTAERIVLELSDRVGELEVQLGAESGGATPNEAQSAVHALTALGMSFQEADRAVRAVLDGSGELASAEIIRKALANR